MGGKGCLVTLFCKGLFDRIGRKDKGYCKSCLEVYTLILFI